MERTEKIAAKLDMDVINAIINTDFDTAKEKAKVAICVWTSKDDDDDDDNGGDGRNVFCGGRSKFGVIFQRISTLHTLFFLPFKH